ncbi:MAG: aldehyde dehydrogenase family protein [Deltaproteobacteria bacterium]
MVKPQSIAKPAEDSTECRCAATNELLGYSPLHNEDHLKGVIGEAREAQKGWAALPVRERARYILRIRDYLVEHIDELSETISRDNGKTMSDAMSGEILPAIMAVTYYCRHAVKFLQDRSLKPAHPILLNKRARIVRVPWGVVAVIAPWNYPFAIPFSEVIMALLAGNAVILKMATQTQLTGLAFKKCIESAGLPPGVFNYVNIPGSAAGDMILENGVDKLFFTGSVPVGQYLMKKASETLTPVSLELGGNDPMLVCEDADIYRAVMGAIWGGYCNSGQSCGGVERVYVHEAIYEPFIRLLKAKVEGLRVGFGMDPDNDMGAMTTRNQVETVKAHLDDALAKGAILYAQSKVPEDNDLHSFLPAMVLTNVNHDMVTMREETFGPIIAIMKVKDMEEALRLANDSDLGLSASVWSKDPVRAEKIARRIQAGAVNINDHLMSHGQAETPWGGFKKSSIGRTHGDIGFEEMTQPQVIIRDILPGVKKDLWWPPNNRGVYEGLRGIIVFWYGHGFSSRLRGLQSFLKISKRMFKAD